MKCVEITMMDDGACRVAECEPKPEMMEGEESGQVYPTVEEAMKAAGMLLGGTPEAERASMEQAFQAAAKNEA